MRSCFGEKESIVGIPDVCSAEDCPSVGSQVLVPNPAWQARLPFPRSSIGFLAPLSSLSCVAQGLS